MREKIERLSKGIFEYDEPSLMLSDNALDLFVQPGEVKSGSFLISCSSGRTVKGIIYSSSPSLKIITKSFVGVENEIFYEYNSEALDLGKQIKGIISIISDCGEKQLPFTVSASNPALAASIGYIGDLQSFSLLAQTDWHEATELFCNPDFYDIIIKGHPSLEVAYDVLKTNSDRQQALEQFLVAVGKKEETGFFVDDTTISADATENFIKTIVVRKTNWGYMKLNVESSDSRFVNPLKTEILNDDFVNGQYELKILVYPTRVKSGIHSASIRIYNHKKETAIPVSVRVTGNNEIEKNNRRNVKKYIVRIYQQYIKFRLGDISLQDFISESKRYAESALLLLDKIYGSIGSDKKYVHQVRGFLEAFRTYLSITDGATMDNSDFLHKLIQKKYEAQREGSSLYAIILYLEALNERDLTKTLLNLQEIKSFYSRLPIDDVGLWIMLHMDPEIEDNEEIKFGKCYEYLQMGNAGNLILYEAAEIVQLNPNFLICSSVNWRILNYMYKHNMLTQGVVSAVIKLISDYQSADEKWLKLLMAFRKSYDSDELIETICTLIVALNLKDEKYHHILGLGIKKKFNIENIYEFYMYTYGKDVQRRIDPAVITYFGFDNQLQEEYREVLYAYIVKNKVIDSLSYNNFLKKIREFALEKLQQKAVSTNLAIIYSDILSAEVIDGEIKEYLPDVMFKASVECRYNNITGIYVKNIEEEDGRFYPIVEGKTDVYIYSAHSQIFLVDESGEKYAKGAKVRVTDYMKSKALLDVCYQSGAVNPKLAVWIFSTSDDAQVADSRLSSVYRQLSSQSGISEKVRSKCSMWLAQYHYDNYNGEMMESYLRDLRYEKGGVLYRSKVIEMMVMRNMYEEALNLIAVQGCDEVDDQSLFKLCVDNLNSPKEPQFHDKLVYASHQLFRRGVYNDDILQYLSQYFVGTTIEMYELWNKANENHCDTVILEENLLAQMLFAKSYIEYAFSVFKSFYFKQKNRTLIRAYMSLAAYNYFVEDVAISADFFEILKNDVSLENSRIGILALLKYYSEKPYLTADEKEFADTHIRKFLQDKMFFAFFKKFENRLQLPAGMVEKYYIEYRTNPMHQVSIHYAYNENDEYLPESMVDMGYGIFTKEVILFKNESLYYVIVESDGENTEIRKKEVIHYVEGNKSLQETKYDEINSIITATEQQDDRKIIKLIEQYYLTEYAMKRHFTPV